MQLFLFVHKTTCVVGLNELFQTPCPVPGSLPDSWIVVRQPEAAFWYNCGGKGRSWVIPEGLGESDGWAAVLRRMMLPARSESIAWETLCN